MSLPPITTPTYALEFQKAIEESSQGRDVLTVKVLFYFIDYLGSENIFRKYMTV